MTTKPAVVGNAVERGDVSFDSTANWTSVNPVLLKNEQATDTTTGDVRVGDGSTPYLTLPGYFTRYVPQLPSTGSYTYDGTGRVTADPDGNTYTYNSDDTIATITKGGVTRTATYSANGIASWA